MIPANAQNPDSKIVLKCVNYTVIKKMIISLPPKNLGFKGMRLYLIQKLEHWITTWKFIKSLSVVMQ